MTLPIKKKLIEVALPLPEINDASAYDKMPGIGPHPKGIHHWWARLPLPTARAILFASVVDDPEAHPEKWPTEEAQNTERERLFDLLRRMMAKKLHEAPEVYAAAHAEMLLHCDGQLPAVFDPFSGGGSIPLEANRMGFHAYAADLNPVAVLLNKCNLEIAPRWINCPPVNPLDRRKIGGATGWRGNAGLAADVSHYSEHIQHALQEQLSSLYPTVTLPPTHGGKEARVVAWIWARTVASENAAAQGIHVPLVSSYWLSNNDKKPVWLESIVNQVDRSYSFITRNGAPANKAVVRAGTKLGRGGKFGCILTDSPISNRYLKEEAQAGRLGMRLIAIVAEGRGGKIYLSASPEHEHAANVPIPENAPNELLQDNARYITPTIYGMKTISSLFTSRQLVAMTTASDLIKESGSDVHRDALAAGLNEADADEYARAVVTFLALALDRCADFNNSLTRWSASNQKVMNLFGRQAIPMVWDFAEANFLGNSVGSWSTCSDYVAQCIKTIAASSVRSGAARQVDAASSLEGLNNVLISTDPPYYDNVPYADISDFFYVWLRRTLGASYKDLFSTVLSPKLPELTATPDRFGGDKDKAKEHFESGFRSAFTSFRRSLAPNFPLTVYYAFKQEDEEEINAENANDSKIDLTTGWETLLEALISSGFQITATWPIRASQAWRMRFMGSNALASYIVLACRPRPTDAPQTASTQFRQELKRTLPAALRHLQQGNIAPVDFAQAAIGPGMAVYSRYSRILDSSGKSMTVRAALGLINQTLTEVLSEQEDDFDADTRWALAWFEQYGFSAGGFGDAELLSKAKVVSVTGLQQSGLILSKGGDVRLLRADELPKDWDPTTDDRRTIWEMTHHLLRLYHHDKAGDAATAELLQKLGAAAEVARDLAYRLFSLSEKKKLSQEAQGYNALVLGWPEIARLAREIRPATPVQPKLI